jgi:hypothetical protein
VNSSATAAFSALLIEAAVEPTNQSPLSMDALQSSSDEAVDGLAIGIGVVDLDEGLPLIW